MRVLPFKVLHRTFLKFLIQFPFPGLWLCHDFFGIILTALSTLIIIIIIINYIYIALNTNKFLSALQKKNMLTYIYFNLTTIHFTTIDK